jgi:hypothetical protein
MSDAPDDPTVAPRTALPALTDVVLALFDARPTPALERFDAEVAAAVAAGKLDTEAARTLRWWQRESDRGVRDYLAAVLPGVLDSLESATLDAAGGVRAAADAWRRAGSVDRAADLAAPPVEPIDMAHRRRRQVVAAMVPFTDSTSKGSPRLGDDA